MPQNKAHLHRLKLDPEEAMTLFSLLDMDQSDSVEIEEFVDGCRKLGRESRVFDLITMQYEIKFLLANFIGFADFMEYHVFRGRLSKTEQPVLPDCETDKNASS